VAVADCEIKIEKKEGKRRREKNNGRGKKC